VPQDEKPNNSGLTVINSEISRKMHLKKKVDELTKGRWNIVQETLIDIQARNEVEFLADEAPKVDLKHQIEALKAKLTEDYADQPELLEVLLESIPSYNSVRKWTASDEWKAAVVDRIRSNHIFNPKQKTKVFEAILKKATVSGDMKAAELYFKLAGDLTNAPKESTKEQSKEDRDYSDFNKILHKK
jgi:hypothetical protein